MKGKMISCQSNQSSEGEENVTSKLIYQSEGNSEHKKYQKFELFCCFTLTFQSSAFPGITIIMISNQISRIRPHVLHSSQLNEICFSCGNARIDWIWYVAVWKTFEQADKEIESEWLHIPKSYNWKIC